jgi:protein-S-isoprenylcysteine O-methyltransferase Ste14
MAAAVSIKREGRIVATRMRELVGTALLAALFISFAWAHYVNFTATHRPSLVFAVATETLLAGFIFVRRPANEVSFSPAAWMTSIGGTFAPLLLRPVDGTGDQLLGTAVQLVGTIASAAGIMSLNRSIGLLPAHRGIRRGGMYRLVRHPLYSAYAVTGIGYLLNHPSARNAALMLVGVGFQVARLTNEERLLSSDPAYLAYKAETRWRLLPFVF